MDILNNLKIIYQTKIAGNLFLIFLYLLGFSLLIFGLIMKILINIQKKKINDELAKKIINFASVFPGEKVFVWPVVNFEVFENISKKEGFIVEFGFDKWYGYLAKNLGKNKRKFLILKKLNFKNSYHHIFLFKQPKFLNIESLKNTKVVTFNFQLSNYQPLKVEDGFYLYKF